MEVILKEDVPKLGHRGEVVKVAEGYGRNYLLPHKLAYALSRVEPYGFFILILLLVTNTIGFFLMPFYEFGVGIVRLFV